VVTSVAEFRSRPDHRDCILEEFAEGDEYSVETFSRHGQHQVVAIAETTTTDNFVEVSHLVPAPGMTPRRFESIARAVAELLDCLGLENGPAHTEVKVHRDDVKIIETHNRPGGDAIADLVAITTGVDWRRTAVGWPLGATPDRSTARAAAAATVFFTAAAGRVSAVLRPPPVFADATVEEWEVDVAVGDSVGELRSSADRVGMAVVSGRSPEAVRRSVEQIRAAGVVVTEAVTR
jgi:biotin carboxylase